MLWRYLLHQLHKKDHSFVRTVFPKNPRIATGIICRWPLPCPLNLLQGVIMTWNWLSLIFRCRRKHLNTTIRNATKITSVLADTWIQFSGPATSTFGKDIVFVLGSYDHFLTMCYRPSSPSFVTMSSSNSIDARRMSKWYSEFTHEGDDSHLSSWNLVSEIVTGTNRSSYQIREPIENDEEGLAMRRDDMPPPVPKGVDNPRTREQQLGPAHAESRPVQTFSVYKLFVTHLALHRWEESRTQTIGLCRQTVQKSSIDRRHADLHRFHFGHLEAPQPPIVAWVPLHLTSNDANHGQFRRLNSTLTLAATSCKRLPHMKRRWIIFFGWIFFWVAIALGGTDPEGEAEPGWKLQGGQADHMVCPVYLSTPLPHTNVGGGRRQTCCWSLVLICAVRGWSEPHHDALYLLFQIKHLSMNLKQRLDRAQSHWLLAIQWIHQGPPSCIPSSVWRREPGRYRSPQNPHWSK